MNHRLFRVVLLLGASTVAVVLARPAEALPSPAERPAASDMVGTMIKLPLRSAAELEQLTRVQSDPRSPEYHQFLTVRQFRARYAPSPATMREVTAQLEAQGFHVIRTDSQVVYAAASVAALEHAFHVRLTLMRDARGTAAIAADRAPALSAGLARQHALVLGLGGIAPRPQPQSRRLAPIPDNRDGSAGPYWFDDLKQAYRYPSYARFTGRGRTIATVGYSDFNDADTALYFNHEWLGGAHALGPLPKTEHLHLGGTRFDPNSATSQEANIDVQQAAGSAPGARVVGVDVPSAGEGFLYGYSALVESDAFDIISTSYSGCELFYTAPYNNGVDQTKILLAYHDIFLQGNAQGVTFVFSSGDDAGLPCPQPAYFAQPNLGKVYHDVPGTSYWSSDPSVTSVGGTNLVTTSAKGQIRSMYRRESAFADTVLAPLDQFGYGNFISNALWGSGGGTSVIFPRPWYQDVVDTGSTMRSDPDVAMQMGGCPSYLDAQGRQIPIRCGNDDSESLAYVGGTLYPFIGTSLAAPEFAGLLAVLEQAQGGTRMGNANGYIYRLARASAASGERAFHEHIPGFNGIVRVTADRVGYNPIVGVGSPIANEFLQLPEVPLAGDPRTSSNP